MPYDLVKFHDMLGYARSGGDLHYTTDTFDGAVDRDTSIFLDLRTPYVPAHCPTQAELVESPAPELEPWLAKFVPGFNPRKHQHQLTLMGGALLSIKQVPGRKAMVVDVMFRLPTAPWRVLVPMVTTQDAEAVAYEGDAAESTADGLVVEGRFERGVLVGSVFRATSAPYDAHAIRESGRIFLLAPAWNAEAHGVLHYRKAEKAGKGFSIASSPGKKHVDPNWKGSYPEYLVDSLAEWTKGVIAPPNDADRRRHFDKAAAHEKGLSDSALEKQILTGAGYPIDQKLRYDRARMIEAVQTGVAHNFPASLSFYELVFGRHVASFKILPEKDHAFDSADFLAFAAEFIPEGLARERLGQMPEAVVHSYSVISDLHDAAIEGPNGEVYVLAGISMVRHGDLVSWIATGGPVCNLAALTHARRAIDVAANPGEVATAMPIAGTTDVLDLWVTGTVDIAHGGEFWRTISVNWGDYSDFTNLDAEVEADASPYSRFRDQIMSHDHLYDLCHTALALPAYFESRVELRIEIDSPTSRFARRPNSDPLAAKLRKKGINRFKKVAAITVSRPSWSTEDSRRTYTPPQFRVEVEGFERRLHNPESYGKDRNGEPLLGRTWVRPHPRHKDKPERTGVILLKSRMTEALDLIGDGRGDYKIKV